MAQKLYEENNIQDIADAIREKNGTSNTYKTSEMADAVRAIVSGGDVPSCGIVVERWSGSGFAKVVRTVGMTGVPSNYFTGLTGFFQYVEEIYLNEGITKIYGYAFSSQLTIDELAIPRSVTEIRDSAFSMAMIPSITFKGTPTTIGTSAFSSCITLANIYVPWAEGEVAGAPWGANDATIHYNHTV